jgi:hypothetical protein
MPAAIERPAGQPSASNYVPWLTYESRRRERAELAGLFFEGERNGYREAWADLEAQHNECRAWAERH